MLSVYWKEVGGGTKGEVAKRHNETSMAVNTFIYLDRGDMFMGIYLCQNSSKSTF